MIKPRSEIAYINGIINKQITEEEFIKNKSDNLGRLTLDLNEIKLLKQDPKLLKKFFLSFSVEGRLKLIFTKEMLGMPQDTFIIKYGLNKKIIQNLKKQHHLDKPMPNESDPVIREITNKHLQILATLAIFTRIPISWIQEEWPTDNLSWNLNHFNFLPDVHFSLEEFNEYVKNTEKNATKDKSIHTRTQFPYLYDVRPIILHLDTKEIYLRTSFWESGGFIIELFGDNEQLHDFLKVKKLIEPYGPLEIGYCETVIEDQINMMIIAKSQAKDISLPPEFKKF